MPVLYRGTVAESPMVGGSIPLPRFQLLELEDLTWFPRTIRDLSTDYLQFMETLLALHKPVIPLLREMLEHSGTSSVVDLCSGGGGPVQAIYEALAADNIHVHFTLTDKFPNTDAFQRLFAQYPSHIQYMADPVDARNVPQDLIGLRTIFNAFHHFAPTSARMVLESAVQARQPIAIFEIPERSLLMIVLALFTPFVVALATPFIRPLRWKHLLWTYVIPLIPLTCWWDGLVSACRAYTAAEMLAMTHGFDDYEWRADRIRVRGKTAHLTYLLGVPRPSRN